MSFRDRKQHEEITRLRSGRSFKGPVGWLMDQQLAVNLKRILRYSAAGEAIDPRNWMAPLEIDLKDEANERGEFWLDYLSDTGDGMKATYGIASLVHSNLFVEPSARPGDRVHFECSRERATEMLPRGQVLVVGGDTAYQVADYETLAERFQEPFNWAFQDLEFDGVVENEPRRPIVAIPANHDYYDFLDGFNRQFRRPFNDERRWDSSSKVSQPYLVLDGFKRVQRASYFSLALPFDWRFFGFDSQEGKMDKRQRHFFREIIADEAKPTKKLIVATPEPTTVHGRRCRESAPIVATMRDVLADAPPQGDDSCPFLAEEPDSVLHPGHCRLDLSGDTHQYARHWGAAAGEEQTASYASVVSGLGGAFLHSTSTDVGEIAPRVLYPSRTQALEATVRRNLDPWAVAKGGRVPAFGVLASFILLIAATASESVSSTFSRVFGWNLPTVSGSSGWLLGPLLEMLRDTLTTPRVRERATQSWNLELLWVVLPFVAASVTFLWYRARKARPHVPGQPESPEVYRWPIWMLTFVGGWSLVGLFLWPDPQRYAIFRPLVSNFLVLLTLGTAFLGALSSQLYDEAMLRQARDRELGFEDKLHLWVLWAFTGLAFLLALNRYGVDSLAVVLTDIAFLVVALGGLIGLFGFGAMTGGVLKRWPGKIAFGLFGLLHGLLQLGAALVYALYLPGHWALAAGAATVALSWLVGRQVPWRVLRGKGERRDRLRLGFVLLALGLAWIAVLVVFTAVLGKDQPVTGATLLVALVLGAVFSCTSLGWYLAVSLCFDGHNGEAGGAARIEKYKQMIRFRIEKDRLTGYVIGFDEPKERYEELEPKLIDVFELRPKGSA